MAEPDDRLQPDDGCLPSASVLRMGAARARGRRGNAAGASARDTAASCVATLERVDRRARHDMDAASSARRPRGPSPMRRAEPAPRHAGHGRRAAAIRTRRLRHDAGLDRHRPGERRKRDRAAEGMGRRSHATGPKARATAPRLATPSGMSSSRAGRAAMAGRSKATTLKPFSTSGVTKAVIAAACPLQPWTRIHGGAPTAHRAVSARRRRRQPSRREREQPPACPLGEPRRGGLDRCARALAFCCMGRGGVQKARKARRPIGARRNGARDARPAAEADGVQRST